MLYKSRGKRDNVSIILICDEGLTTGIKMHTITISFKDILFFKTAVLCNILYYVKARYVF